MALTAFVWTLALFSLHNTYARKISTEVNPGCGGQCDIEYGHGFPNLVYTKSESEEDTLHHVWSTVGGSPSLLLLQASSNESLMFSWSVQNDEIIPNISISEQPLYALALVINKIWEFEDPKDTGVITDLKENVFPIDLDSFVWQNTSGALNTSEQSTSVLFRTKSNSSDIGEDGLFSLQLETRGDSGRNDIIPRLLYSSNSSQVCVVLDKFNPRFEKSRYALEISIFINENVPSDVDTFRGQSVKSMDDEYTPGVFKSIHLVSKESQDKKPGSYFSWKPVAYTSEDLSVTGSTGAVNYDLVKRNISNSSVAENFFQNNFDLTGGMAVNVSFGTSQDGFYIATNYTKWTFSYGLGVPIEDELSSLVKIILASGLGLPMLLIVLSSVYLVWHKLNMKKDDLSLSRR